MKGLTVLSLLLWLCAAYFVGIYLFVGGFLLVRLEVNRTSACGDVLQPGAESADFCRGPPRFRRVVVLIIDALKIDFARFDPTKTAPRPYENKLPVLEETVSARPAQSRLYPFRADPPTTTMQRIKGFTTGSLPTFVDVGNNFASSAILEDNLIHQLGQMGKRVVFMGDDTWENLFPKKFYRSLPFPSFNVKDLDTVDNGILQHLYSTMMGDDWDVLLAHFLGVDHCGHRFGPDHPAMADKLTQMDGVIRSVMERLQDDTLLVVMGDHGMTDTGDHGGESQKETDAALFLYSPSAIFPGPPTQDEPDVVPQTDLVPTLALLLGIPIPFSSVGQILLPLFPPHEPTQGAGRRLGQLEALWINTKQVHRFLDTYSSLSTDIPPERLSELTASFSLLSSDYLGSVGAGRPPPPPHLASSLQAYLTSVRDTCRATWARFNPAKMAAGLAVLTFACLACLVMSELSAVLTEEKHEGLKGPVAAAITVGVAVAAAQLVARGYVEAAWCLAAGAFASEALFLWRAWRLNRQVVLKNGAKTWRLSARCLLAPSLAVPLLRCASLLSDSYVIYEGRVVTFLLLSLALYVPLRLNWDGHLVPLTSDPLKPSGLLPSPALTPAAVRKESSSLIGCLGVLVLCACVSLWFHGCREEQGGCSPSPSPFLSPLSRLQDSQLKNLYYILSVASLGVCAFLLRLWLCHHGNLNSSGGTAFAARWVLPLLCVCAGLHWAVGAAPQGGFRKLAELIRVAQLALPRAAFALLGLGLALIWADPLTVFLKTRAAASARSPALPARYRASTAISPQAELRHLIPQIYQRMRRSLEDGELGGSEEDGRPAVEAYGLGTVYSAPLLLHCGLLGVGLLLLHPEALALAFLLLLLEAAALLHIHAAAANLGGSPAASTGVFGVAWTPVVLWSLAASQFFHSTGHLPTFPSIQWGAAFVGFPDGHSGTFLPACLVTLNTFASHILFAVGCPLLLFWPLVREVRGVKGHGEEGEDAVMEMRLREKPHQFSAALLQLSARYVFILGAQVFSSVCAAAILRRHLMVWKVFAPKLLFEASGFVVSCCFLLIGVSLVLRVDVAVGHWFKKLIPDASR